MFFLLKKKKNLKRINPLVMQYQNHVQRLKKKKNIIKMDIYV